MRTHTTIRVLGLAAAALLVLGCKGDDSPRDTGPSGKDLVTSQEAGKTDGGKKPDAKKPDGSGAKKPVISKILPDNGFSSGNLPVTIVGESFVAGMSAYIDGQPLGTAVVVASPISASFTMPKNPYDKPYKVGVMVMVNQQSSNTVYFQYHETAAMDASFKGSLTTAKVDCFRDFPSDPIEGRVSLQAGPDAGAAPALRAEVGIGTVGSNPGKDLGWKWFAATFVKKDGAYDVYAGTIKPVLSQTYDLAYRFSKDNGQHWVYADTDETNLAYEPSKAGKLTATDPPVGYCLVNEDCIVNKYEVTCKVDSIDKKKNTCIECLQDSDCAGYAKALGPHCTKNLCGCAADTECAKNPNGAKCLKQGGYCGCEGDQNCVSPSKCTQDQKTGLQTCM